MKYEGKLTSKIKVDCKSFLGNEAGEIVMGNTEMAEELNRYFASVYTVEDNNCLPELQEIQETELSVVAIAKEKALGKLNGLKVDKSSRPDRLHLRELAKEIVE
eukprot:g42840.t1